VVEVGFGLAFEVGADVVEVFELLVIGTDVREVAQLQPLADEVFGEGLVAPVSKQALDLGGELGAELLLAGELEKGFIWRGGPEEVGQSGGESEFVDEFGACDGVASRLWGGVIKESGGNEHAFKQQAQGGDGGFACLESLLGELGPLPGFCLGQRAAKEAGGHAQGKGGHFLGQGVCGLQGAGDAEVVKPKVAILLGGLVVVVV
jgi:hypothetical protein